MIKVFALADVHMSPQKDLQGKCLKSLDFLIEKVREEKPDVITIAGDIFDRSIQNTEESGFTIFKEKIKALLEISPIYAIYGTPSHDVPGSLDIFEDIDANNKFNVLKPGVGVIFNDELLLLGIPEPNKSWLLATDDKCLVGGGESDKALNELMKNFINGLGVLRDERPDLPCMVLGHLVINGASLSSVQTLPGGGVSISSEDLRSINANHYSIGHIHYRQMIDYDYEKNGDSIIMYEGSIHPKTWGELEPKAFTEIVIDKNNKVDYAEHFFPHAPMNKVTLPPTGSPLFKTGERVWFDIQGSKTELIDFDAVKYLDEMIELGADPDSRVTVKIINEETLRASEIIEKKSLFEKVEVYARNTGLELPVDIEKKCSELEAIVSASGFNMHNKRSLRLDRLELRGSIGIWKGQGTEEKIIKFDEIDEGTIALIGENGCGKSTIMKQCNPFPDSLEDITSGAIKNDFFLRDSYSNTYWTDEETGTSYKCQKLIDGKNKSGKTEFFLFKEEEGVAWVPYNAEQTGRKEPYRKAVMEIFGSPDLFRRSVYIAQKGVSLPNSVTEKKELFNDLLGNEYLEQMSEIAKQKVNDLQSESINIDGQIQGVSSLGYGLKSEIEEAIKKADDDILSVHLEIKKIANEGEKLKTHIEALQNLNNQNNETALLAKTEKQKEIDLIDKSKVMNDEINHIKINIEAIPELQKRIADTAAIETQIEIEKDRIVKIEYSNNEFNLDYQKKLSDYESNLSTLDIELKSLDHNITHAKGSIENKEGEIEFKEQTIADLNLRSACEKCSHVPEKISGSIKALETEIETAQSGLLDLSEKLLQYQLDFDSLNKKKEDFEKIKPVEPAYRNTASFHSYLDELSLKLMDPEEKEEIESIVKNSVSDQEKLKLLQSDIKKVIDQAAEASEKNIEYESKLDDTLSGKLQRKEVEREKLREEYSGLQAEKTTVESDLKNNKANLERHIKQEEELKVLKEKSSKITTESLSWQFMQQSTGKKGVQALELDALVPSIANMANRLLDGTYGNKYTIEFSTTKEVGSGKNAYQAESFDIFVIDNEEPKEELKRQKLETLSGGQEIWILKAIYDSFSVIREQNTGLKFKTSLQDEVDGALSSDNKHQYLSMLESAHRESGRKHTILITHDQGIQSIVRNKIQL